MSFVHLFLFNHMGSLPLTTRMQTMVHLVRGCEPMAVFRFFYARYIHEFYLDVKKIMTMEEEILVDDEYMSHLILSNPRSKKLGG